MLMVLLKTQRLLWETLLGSNEQDGSSEYAPAGEQPGAIAKLVSLLHGIDNRQIG